jgi:hypothetical protein
MSETLSDEIKQQVVIAAATIAGPAGTASDVQEHIKRIAGYLQPGSSVQYAFTELDKQAAVTTETKVLMGTLLGLGKETTSNRGIVIFRTKEHEEYAIEGKELLRTEIASGTGSTGSDHLNALKNLVGHKLRVSFAIEKMPNNRNVRVLRGYADLGVDADYDFEKPEFHPVFYTDHVKAKQVSKVERFIPTVPALAAV